MLIMGYLYHQVLEALKDSSSSRPAIFAMSNPTKNGLCHVIFHLMFIICCISYLIMYSFHFVAECTPGEAFSILGEKVIFASGSPFHDVDLGTSFDS